VAPACCMHNIDVLCATCSDDEPSHHLSDDTYSNREGEQGCAPVIGDRSTTHSIVGTYNPETIPNNEQILDLLPRQESAPVSSFVLIPKGPSRRF
jgi:hypothetical protein